MSEYQPQMTVHSAVELVVAVVDTAQAESVLRVYRENRALVSFECMARGTAWWPSWSAWRLSAS